MTPLQMYEAVLATVGEQEGIFHTQANIKPLVQQGEQLLGIFRGLTEKTVTLPLVYGQAFYAIHPPAPDFIYPLRVSIVKKQLFPTTLSRIMDRDPAWMRSTGTPQYYFLLGATYLAFYPTPPSSAISANVTYVAQPPVPLDTASYAVAPEWHEALAHYASAILLVKEQKYELAAAELQAYLDVIGMPRDTRMGPAEVRGTVSEQPLHQAVESQLG